MDAKPISTKPRFQFSLISAVTVMLIAAVLIGVSIHVFKSLQGSQERKISFLNSSGTSLKEIAIKWNVYGSTQYGLKAQSALPDESRLDVVAENHLSVVINYSCNNK